MEFLRDKRFHLDRQLSNKLRVEYLVVSCKGIVCFRGLEKGKQIQIFLYNPSTKYLFALPIDSGKGFSNASISRLGFGYVASSQKFKVLSLYTEINPAPHFKCRIMEISHYDGASAAAGVGRNYSDWKDVEYDCPHLSKINSPAVKSPTVLEDTIYWVTREDLIVSSNVQDETLMVPNQGNRSLDSDDVFLIDFQEKLGFVLPSRSDGCFSMVIWRLEDSVWESQYNISLEGCDDHFWFNLKPICVRNGKILLYSRNCLVIYNTDTDSYRRLYQPRSSTYCAAVVTHHESLFCLGPNQEGRRLIACCDESTRPPDFTEEFDGLYDPFA